MKEKNVNVSSLVVPCIWYSLYFIPESKVKSLATLSTNESRISERKRGEEKNKINGNATRHDIITLTAVNEELKSNCPFE